MHFIYGCANGNGRDALRMYREQFPDRQIPDHRKFQRLHRQLNDTGSNHLTRHEAGRKRVVRSASLEKSILNTVGDRPESRTIAVIHQASVIAIKQFVEC